LIPIPFTGLPNSYNNDPGTSFITHINHIIEHLDDEDKWCYSSEDLDCVEAAEESLKKYFDEHPDELD